MCMCVHDITHYIGKDDSLGISDAGMTHAVVMKLADPIKSRGHHIYTDLRDNGFGACGTLRLNRRGLPAAIKENVRKGEKKAFRLDPSMLAIKWMDKRAVTVLTTVHDNTEVEVERRTRHAAGGRERSQKPLLSTTSTWVGWILRISCCRTMALATVQLSGGGGHSSFFWTLQW